jgi:hypothetical protein
MATRKRTSRRTGLVGRAVSAGRSALREAEKRIPPDLRRQLDRRLKDADKTARAAIKQLQAQVKKASTRADVNSVLKRIDELTKQARQVARGSATRAATTRRRATSATRSATTRRQATSTARGSARRTATRTRKAAVTPRKRAATTTTTRRAATAGAARPATTRRVSAPRRRTRPARPEMAEITETVIPVEGGEIDVIEVTES